MKFQASVVFSRFVGSRNGWEIRIYDKVSGCPLIDMQLTDAEMGAALGSSFTHPEREAEVWLQCPIGKKAELKTISFDDPATDRMKHETAMKVRVEEAIRRESDGWKYDGSHRSQGFVTGNKVNATYRRYVSPP